MRIEGREDRVDFVLKIIEEKKPGIITIDGPCASGKTTLVNDLRNKLDFSIISMDDFFLPPELRTRERFLEKGGNVHYERFIDEVIWPLKEGKAFSYRKFSCASLSYKGEVYVSLPGLVIVEGSYALHPKFEPYWDISILLSVSKEEQIRRLTLRSPEKIDMFRKQWIPLENEYFSSCDISSRATYTI